MKSQKKSYKTGREKQKKGKKVKKLDETFPKLGGWFLNYLWKVPKTIGNNVDG